MAQYFTDIARSNPFEQPMRLWEQNPAFLQLIENLDQFWRRQNIEWRFGIEHEFFVKMNAEDQLQAYADRLKTLMKSGGSSPKPSLNELRTEYQIYFGDTKAESPLFHSLSEEYQRVSRMLENRKKLKPALESYFRKHPHLSAAEKSEKLEALAIFDDYDCIMAALHEFWVDAKLLSYRFGSERHGLGYYDAGNTLEVRTPPLSAQKAMHSYHTLIHTLNQAAQDYGFAIFHTPNLHVNISAHELVKRDWKRDWTRLYRRQPDRLLTDIQGQSPVSFHSPDGKQITMSPPNFFKNVVEGVCAFARDCSYMTMRPHAHQAPMTVGTSREHQLRILKGRLEYRPAEQNDTTQLSLYMATLLSGATYGLLFNTPKETEVEADTTYRQAHFKIADAVPPNLTEAAQFIADILRESRINARARIVPETWRIDYVAKHHLPVVQLFDPSYTKFDPLRTQENSKYLVGELAKIEVTGAHRLIYRGDNQALKDMLRYVQIDPQHGIFPTLSITLGQHLKWLAREPVEYQLPRGSIRDHHSRHGSMEQSALVQRMFSTEWLPQYPDLLDSILKPPRDVPEPEDKKHVGSPVTHYHYEGRLPAQAERRQGINRQRVIPDITRT